MKKFPAENMTVPDSAVFCDGVTLSLGKRQILGGVTFAANKGEITVLLGKNGSGKSTLFRCISGIAKPDGGRIYLGGIPVDALSNNERAKKVAVMPQYLPQLRMTVGELIAMGRSPYHGLSGRLTAADKRIVQFAASETDSARYSDRSVGTLSGGERQLAFLAMALAQDTPLVLLDEPTSSLDSEYRLKVFATIKKLRGDKTFIATVHNLDEAAAIADRIIVLHEGKTLFAGTRDEFLKSGVSCDVFSLKPVVVTDGDGNRMTIFRPKD